MGINILKAIKDWLANRSKSLENTHELDTGKATGFTIYRMANGELMEITNSDCILLANMLLDEKCPIVFRYSLPATGEDGTLYVIKEDKGLCTNYDLYTWSSEEGKFIHRKTIESYI